jgi:2-methylcitrate dehydratase PrpD
MHVAAFVEQTRAQDIPDDVIALGKKSILDGLGLALSGAVAKSGELVRRHLDDLGLGSGAATVIGSQRRVAPRFAAFANGVGIHADDYDDTQLAVAPDRVYGLLTHPTAPALPAALAVGEATGADGRSTRGRVQDRRSDQSAALPDRLSCDRHLRDIRGRGGERETHAA